MNYTHDGADDWNECPNCGQTIENAAEYFDGDDDPSFDCPHCGKGVRGWTVTIHSLTAADE